MTTPYALHAAYLHGRPVLVHWLTAAGDALQQPAVVVSLPGEGRVVVHDLHASARHGRPIYRVRLVAQIVRVEPLPVPEGGDKTMYIETAGRGTIGGGTTEGNSPLGTLKTP